MTRHSIRKKNYFTNLVSFYLRKKKKKKSETENKFLAKKKADTADSN